jgi:hypothetical protein
MKAHALYKRVSTLAAKISSELTTQKLTRVERFIEDKSDRFLAERDFSDDWTDVYTDVYQWGLVEGYIIGQLFDFSDPDILQNLEVIKKELVKEALFAFLPKKKAA